MLPSVRLVVQSGGTNVWGTNVLVLLPSALRTWAGMQFVCVDWQWMESVQLKLRSQGPKTEVRAIDTGK